MDIDYLLLLQNFREATGNVLSPFMMWASDVAIGFWPFAITVLIYLVFDRAGGKRIMGGFALGAYLNGLLKLVCCVYRPWIRDARVQPYGNAKASAGGYSFPSGHSTYSTCFFGGFGVWQWKRHKPLAILCFLFVAIVLFSRNYLGVHTPQDVVVGCLATSLMIWVAYKVEAWTDEDPSRDLTVLIAGVALAVVSGVFYLVKPYPMDYAADGSLLVDPVKMMFDSFQGLGLLSSYVICRYFERRGPDFEALLTRRQRFVVAAICIPLLAAWMLPGRTAITELIDARAGNFINIFVFVALVLVAIPRIMAVIAKRLNGKEPVGE